MYNQGTAQRTDAWIIDETAGPFERSDRNMPMIIASEIGTVIIQNRFHPLTAVLFKTLFMPPHAWFRLLCVMIHGIMLP